MHKYRLIEKDYHGPRAMEYLGEPIIREVWRGCSLPTLDEHAAILEEARVGKPLIGQERFFIACLARTSVGIGWMDVPDLAESNIPPERFRIIHRIESTGKGLFELPDNEDVLWQNDRAPNQTEWNTAMLESDLKFSGKPYGIEFEGPVFQMARYIKFGRKVKELGWADLSNPIYV